jgi:hypothetical protein
MTCIYKLDLNAYVTVETRHVYGMGCRCTFELKVLLSDRDM